MNTRRLPLYLIIFTIFTFSFLPLLEAKDITGKYQNKSGNTFSVVQGDGAIAFHYEGTFTSPTGTPHICDCARMAKASGSDRYEFSDKYNPASICSIEGAGDKVVLKEVKGGTGSFCGCCGAGWKQEEFVLKTAKPPKKCIVKAAEAVIYSAPDKSAKAAGYVENLDEVEAILLTSEFALAKLTGKFQVGGKIQKPKKVVAGFILKPNLKCP